MVRVNFRNLHTMCVVRIYSHNLILLQNIRELNSSWVLFAEIIYTSNWRNVLLHAWIHFATVRKLRKFSLTKNIFREIISLVISLLRTLLSRNFCQKSARLAKQISAYSLCGKMVRVDNTEYLWNVKEDEKSRDNTCDTYLTRVFMQRGFMMSLN